MGIRAYNRCLTIAVITILILLVTHVILLIYFRNPTNDILVISRTSTVSERNHHPRKEYKKNIPTPIQIQGMNCTTTSLGGLNCDHEINRNVVRNDSYAEPPIMYFYNDEVHYYNSCAAMYIPQLLLLFIINVL